MPKVKRATVYLDPSLHRALRVKAAEDAADLAAFKARAREPVLAFAAVLKDLKRRGKL